MHTLESLLAKTRQEGSCQIWAGNPKSRYGFVVINGKTRTLHRVAFELARGVIPEGMVIRHLCHEKKCINPAHLEYGTHKQNTQDSVKDGRMCRGEDSPKAKLSTAEAFVIKKLLSLDVPVRRIAAIFPISGRGIRKIREGVNWRHIAS